jgi:hypothetical protein
MSHERPERRASNRPAHGDRLPCPHCGTGTIEFNERFRFDGAMSPAWVCDNPRCPVSRFAARRGDVASNERKS